MLVECAVVDQGILNVQLQVLGEEVVSANLVEGLAGAPFLAVAVDVVAGF